MPPRAQLWLSVAAVLSAAVICSAAASAEQRAAPKPATRIVWDSRDIVESLMPRYKYRRIGPVYEKPADPKAPSPGRNFMIELTVLDDPPRLLDKLLTRHATITGRVVGAPDRAATGSVWLEDNYGRVIDKAAVTKPNFSFYLKCSRSISLGLGIRAELKGGGKVLWSGRENVRMVPPAGDDPWADYVLGVYNTGRREGTGRLFREMGLTHQVVQTTNTPIYVAQADLRFHASNIVYSLLGFYHRDLKRWRQIKAAQSKARGPVKLARHRCLSDPKQAKFITDILTCAAMRFKPYRPLHYGIGDEIGIGNMGAPYDLCGSKWCLTRYRKWLKVRYRTLGRLNAQWQTDYKGWDEVEMFSNWQALERAKTGNFSPWADRVEFMDAVLAEAVNTGVRAVRKVDRQARCSVTGTQQPCCWGYDLWRLCQVVDAMTPYDIGEGPDVIMSFYNDGADGRVFCPGFGQQLDRLWRAFCRGYDMNQQWDSFGGKTYSRLIDIERKALTPLGKSVQVWADWVHAGPGRMRNRARRRRDPVAILYSQPSLRGNWILEIAGRKDVPQTGENWVGRDSWTVRQKELSFRVRVSWSMWLRDVGVWPKYVDASQVDAGALAEGGYKVLVLPRAVALSDSTARAIRKFAAAGGTVIADSWPGIMDEHCRLRENGVLDKMFGVTRGDWRKIDVRRLPASGDGLKLGGGVGNMPFLPFEKTLKARKLADVSAGGSSGGADVAIVRRVGKGRAIYLNFNLEEYFLHRFFPKIAAPARGYLLKLLAEAGVKPLFAVSDQAGKAPFPAVGNDVCVYRSGRGFLVGVMVNPTTRNEELGGIEPQYEKIADNVFEKPQNLRLKPPLRLWAYDLRRRKALGAGKVVDLRSGPREAQFLAFWPFEIKGVSARAVVTPKHTLRVTGELETSAPVKGEKLAVAMRAFRPDGSEQRAYRRTIDCKGNEFVTEIPLGLNERGKWTIEVTEPCTGKTAKRKISLDRAAR